MYNNIPTFVTVNSLTEAASYQRRYKHGTSGSLVKHSTLKGTYRLFLNSQRANSKIIHL